MPLKILSDDTPDEELARLMDIFCGPDYINTRSNGRGGWVWSCGARDASLPKFRRLLEAEGYDAESGVAWAREYQGFCDCEVAFNAIGRRAQMWRCVQAWNSSGTKVEACRKAETTLDWLNTYIDHVRETGKYAVRPSRGSKILPWPNKPAMEV